VTDPDPWEYAERASNSAMTIPIWPRPIRARSRWRSTWRRIRCLGV